MFALKCVIMYRLREEINLELGHVVLSLKVGHAKLFAQDLLHGQGHAMCHVHPPTHVEVPPLLVQNCQHLFGHLLPQDILHVDLFRYQRQC